MSIEQDLKLGNEGYPLRDVLDNLSDEEILEILNKHDSDYNDLQSRYDQLHKAFEELLSSSSGRRYPWEIDGTHLKKRNEFNQKWKTKAGLTQKQDETKA